MPTRPSSQGSDQRSAGSSGSRQRAARASVSVQEAASRSERRVSQVASRDRPGRRRRRRLEAAGRQVGDRPEAAEHRPVQQGRGTGPLEPEAAELLGPVVVGRERQVGPERPGEGEGQGGDVRAEPVGLVDQEERAARSDGLGGGGEQAGQRLGVQVDPGGDGLEGRRGEQVVGAERQLVGPTAAARLGVGASPAGPIEEPGRPAGEPVQLGRVEPDAVGEVAAGPSPEAALGLVLAGPGGQPGDVRRLADPPIAEGPRRRGCWCRGGRPASPGGGRRPRPGSRRSGA